MKQKPELTKIRVGLPKDAWHGVEAEWVWGEHVHNDIYILRNVPFYAMGLSYEDQIKVEEQDGILNLLGVVARGGHSTYRIFASKGHQNSTIQALLKKLNALHCDIEGATKSLLAVDVLPEADIYKVYATLKEAKNNKIIDFEEGHCGHPLTSRTN